MTVRVRIAPSPTGHLHVGTARAALFNWLYARRQGGVFIVRSDDTDATRSTPEFEADILESLRWLGLDWDEGVEVGGPHGSYRQSDRFDRYREVADALVASGHAYRDERGAGELEALRARAVSESKNPNHYIRRPEIPAEGGVVRLAVPQDAPVAFSDLVRGEVVFEPESIDDYVLLRSDGTPTYHLASTVDDVDYRITHVARGEDLLASTPKHILLVRAMGAEPAVYAHLPLLFGPDGKKLSKRASATSVAQFREEGYLPEAMFNYLALLGWSPGDDLTIFDRETAVARFDLGDVQRNPAVFDLDKLGWMNGEYVRAMELSRFTGAVRPLVNERVGRPATDEEWTAFEGLAPLVQERTRLLPDAVGQAMFLFLEEPEYDQASWDKVMGPDAPTILARARHRLEALDAWSGAAIEQALRGLVADLGLGAGKVFQPIRVAVTGSSVSPPLFESLEALGRPRAVARIEAALGRL